MVGFALGLFRLAVDTPPQLYADWEYAQGSFLWIVHNVYFQYWSLFIFLVSAMVMIGVSYAGKAPDEAQITGLTYGTITDEHRRATRDSWDWRDIAASTAVLLAILAAYLYFNG